MALHRVLDALRLLERHAQRPGHPHTTAEQVADCKTCSSICANAARILIGRK